MAEYLRKLKIKLVRGEYPNLIKGQVRGPDQLYKTFRALEDSAQEKLIGVYLHNNLEVAAYDVLSLGGSSATAMEPDEVFGRAVLMRTRYVVLIHNHPKGDPRPSLEDIECMNVLIVGARTLKKEMLDFIIVGENGYWSMFEGNTKDYTSGSPF